MAVADCRFRVGCRSRGMQDGFMQAAELPLCDVVCKLLACADIECEPDRLLRIHAALVPSRSDLMLNTRHPFITLQMEGQKHTTHTHTHTHTHDQYQLLFNKDLTLHKQIPCLLQHSWRRTALPSNVRRGKDAHRTHMGVSENRGTPFAPQIEWSPLKGNPQKG